MSRRWTVVVALGFPVAAANAAEPPVALTWTAPTGCPSEQAVLGEAQRILAGSTTHRVVARADVAEIGPEHWSVRLLTEVDGVAGERTLEANSCASLASATALILAWTVDPTAAPNAERTRPVISSPPARDEAGRAPAPSAPVPIHALVGAAAELDRGMLPTSGVGGAIALGALVGPLRAELVGTDWLEQDALGTTGGGTHIHLWEGALRACFRGEVAPRLELSPCVGGGWVHASSHGFGLTPPYDQTSDWGTVQADAMAVWTIAGPLALRASIGILAPLVRPPFVIVDAQRRELPIHRSGAVVGRAGLGVEAHFP